MEHVFPKCDSFRLRLISKSIMDFLAAILFADSQRIVIFCKGLQ